MLLSRTGRRPVLALALALLAGAGCDSLLETEPVGQVVIENSFATPEGQILYVNSVYGPLTGLYGSFGAPMATILETGTDDGWPRAQSFDGLKDRDIDPSFGPLQTIYSAHYLGIQRANSFLARTAEADFTGREALQGQLRGEVLFFRAFYYFNLVRLFGDVPLFTAELSTIPEAQAPRAPMAEVYARIKADLAEAIPLLPPTYTGSGTGNEFGRVTQGAARTLLTDVHLTLREWASALEQAQAVAGYALRPTYRENFYGLLANTSGENRVESIFEVQYTAAGPGPKNSLRVSYAPSGSRDGQSQILPTDSLYTGALPGSKGRNAIVQAYATTDARRAVVIDKYGRTTSQTSSYPGAEFFVRKWWSDVQNTQTAWNIPIYRYADLLLMQAEAHAELGQSAEALALVNRIRARAGLPATTATDARAAVRTERRLELAFEHKRLFDLNRWGILQDVLTPQGITISASKVTAHPLTGQPQVLYPIPALALQRNPQLTQNAGY